MKYLCIFFFITTPFFCFSQDDTLTFIGQLGFGTEKKIVDSYIEGQPQFGFFDKNFEISCNFHDRSLRAFKIWSSVAPRETYYDGKFLGKHVEVRIKVLKRSFIGSNERYVDIDVSSKNRNIPKQPIPGGSKISLQIDPVNQINNTTYKIEKFIGISGPEEFSIPMIIDYISARLYGDSILDKNFLSTILDLDRFYQKSFTAPFLKYDQLIKFYDLLHFIEPFVNEKSFLNEEARKLDFRLSQMSDSVFYKQFDRKLNVDLINEYNFGKDVYQDYQKFYAKLNGYYRQLQAILFLRTPSQIEGYRNNRLAPIHTNTTKEAKLKFTIGTAITYGLSKIYNITTTPPSDSSRVQFQNISRLNTILSAGLIWSPFSKQNANDSNSVDNNIIANYPRSNFSLGFFLDYYLYPSQRQVSFISPFGIGLGIGYSKNNFGILGKISFNTFRYPRQFFIDSFRNQNRPLGSYASGVNINDNFLFFDKTNISLGITVVYIFPNLWRKNDEY